MLVMDKQDMDRTINRMAYEIVEKTRNEQQIALVGIQRRGVCLARRLTAKIAEITGQAPEFGTLDITLYRDDLSLIASHPVINGTDIPFSVEDKVVFLIDDVLYTGRTVRCAMEILMDMGRPRAVRLGVLIDRGHRELPIGADVVGKKIPTSRSEAVHVLTEEFDQAEGVSIEKNQKG